MIGIPGMPGPKVIIGFLEGDWNTRDAWTKGNYWLLVKGQGRRLEYQGCNIMREYFQDYS